MWGLERKTWFTTDDHVRHHGNCSDHGTEGGEGPSHEGIGEKCEILKFQGICINHWTTSKVQIQCYIFSNQLH